MIRAHIGDPGGGKTYAALLEIIDALKRKRRVYTNIEGLDVPEHREMLRHLAGLTIGELEDLLIYMASPREKDKEDYPFQVAVFWTFVKEGSLVVIDEVHKTWSARDYASQGNKAFTDWCSTHRHYGFDVILITQALEKIDSYSRSSISWTYRYKKNGFMGRFFERSYMEFAYNEDDTRYKMGQKVRYYKPEIFRAYKSFVSKDIKQLRFGRPPNMFRHPVFIALPLVLGIAIYMLFGKSSLATGDVFGTKASLARAVEHKESVSLDKGKGYWLAGKWVSEEKKEEKKTPIVNSGAAAAAGSPALDAKIVQGGELKVEIAVREPNEKLMERFAAECEKREGGRREKFADKKGMVSGYVVYHN